MGIEPTSSAWKAEVLPLNYTRQTHCRCIYTGCYPATPFIRWRGGGLYSGHPALRPPGRRALRSVRNRSRRFREPPSVQTLPREGKSLKPDIWWRGEDLNLRRLSRQIYSLIPLTTREPLQNASPLLSCRRWWLSTAKDAVAGHEAREYHHRIRGCVGRKYNYKYSLGKRVSRHGLSAN